MDRNEINLLICDKLLHYYREMYQDEEKDKPKLIKEIESMARKVEEYGRFIKYLRHEMNLTYCSVLKHVDLSDPDIKASVEMHHYPFTLYDITEVILNKYVEELFDEIGGIDTFIIANDVVVLHYTGYVGIVPLSATMHELVHSGGYILTKDNVAFGNPTRFYDEYKKWFSTEMLNKYTEYLESTNNIEEVDKLNKAKLALGITTIKYGNYERDDTPLLITNDDITLIGE